MAQESSQEIRWDISVAYQVTDSDIATLSYQEWIEIVTVTKFRDKRVSVRPESSNSFSLEYLFKLSSLHPWLFCPLFFYDLHIYLQLDFSNNIYFNNLDLKSYFYFFLKKKMRKKDLWGPTFSAKQLSQLGCHRGLSFQSR